MVTTVADVEQAYLWSKLEEDVYVKAPAGLPVPAGHVLKLLKAIYGMPQAGREFWKLLRGIIMKLGFTQSEHAHCFFWKRTENGFIILMTYVDDLTITSDNEEMRKEVLDAINEVVTLDDRGVIKSFLVMDFNWHIEEHYWHITQRTFTEDLCASMGLLPETAKAAFTPEIKRNWTWENSTAQDDAERLRVNNYNPRSKAGSILWLIACSRPDLMHSLKAPSQFLSDAGTPVVARPHGLGGLACSLRC